MGAIPGTVQQDVPRTRPPGAQSCAAEDSKAPVVKVKREPGGKGICCLQDGEQVSGRNVFAEAGGPRPWGVVVGVGGRPERDGRWPGKSRGLWGTERGHGVGTGSRVKGEGQEGASRWLVGRTEGKECRPHEYVRREGRRDREGVGEGRRSCLKAEDA